MSDYEIAIIKYEAGNYGVISSTLEKLKKKYIISDEKDVIKKSKYILIPGVGTFGSLAETFLKNSYTDILKDKIDSDCIVIAICSGFQIFFKKSDENPDHSGIGIFDGNFKKLLSDQVKIPNIGWRYLNIKIGGNDFSDFFYFNHSYFLNSHNDSNIKSYLKYGNNTIPAFYNYKNFYGFQFHPELSYKSGIKILKTLLDK